jgi:4-methyl-5(b-hydroxyethyl)-thiazole monophosphate biosynthesis
MAQAAVLLANGFEEIEAVTIIDVLRRGGVEVKAAALEGDSVLGSHDIRVAADCSIDELDVEGLDAEVLTGGLPGAEKLRDDARVKRLLVAAAAAKKLVCAICAAPIALDAAGVIEGRRATSYPGFALEDAEYVTDRVVEEDHIVTSRGPGTALEFSLALVRRLVGHERATELRQKMLVRA